MRRYRIIRDLLSEKFSLDLKDAIFDIEDEMLVPAAGHCVRCPKRTGNAPEFDDINAPADRKDKYGRYLDRAPVHGTDVCTDPDCFAEKKKAHLKREAAKLQEAGKVVVQGSKARQAIDAGGNIKGGFIKLADVRDALKKVAKDAKPTVVTIQDPRNGKTHQVVKIDEVKAAGVKVKEPNGRALLVRSHAELVLSGGKVGTDIGQWRPSAKPEPNIAGFLQVIQNGRRHGKAAQQQST